jgi:hypothetical protein
LSQAAIACTRRSEFIIALADQRALEGKWERERKERLLSNADDDYIRIRLLSSCSSSSNVILAFVIADN